MRGHEDVAKALVKHDFHRHARIGATQKRGERVLPRGHLFDTRYIAINRQWSAGGKAGISGIQHGKRLFRIARNGGAADQIGVRRHGAVDADQASIRG